MLVDSAHVFWSIQYLGSTSVTKTHGPGSTDDAVKSIVHHVRFRPNYILYVVRICKLSWAVYNQLALHVCLNYSVCYVVITMLLNTWYAIVENN